MFRALHLPEALPYRHPHATYVQHPRHVLPHHEHWCTASTQRTTPRQRRYTPKQRTTPRQRRYTPKQRTTPRQRRYTPKQRTTPRQR
eukprot:353089-Chlamydomonas_euryale.AAC.1